MKDAANYRAEKGESDSERVVDFYSNGVRVSFSEFDMEIQFRLVDSRLESKGGINLRISPKLAKRLCEGLSDQIAEFEKQFGKLV